MRIALVLATGLTVDFVLSAQGFVPVDGGRHLLIREGKAFQSALDDRSAEFRWE